MVIFSVNGYIRYNCNLKPILKDKEKEFTKRMEDNLINSFVGKEASFEWVWNGEKENSVMLYSGVFYRELGKGIDDVLDVDEIDTNYHDSLLKTTLEELGLPDTIEFEYKLSKLPLYKNRDKILFRRE